MKKGRVLTVLMVVMFIVSIPFMAQAAVPQTINYQGYLTNSSGQPVSGQVSIVFSLYNVQTEGTALWTETQATVSVNNGVYSISLGSVNPVNLSFDTQYYLGVKVGADAEMLPRQALTSTPYAMKAEKATSADSVPDLSIGTVQIGDGAVTDAKISGTISTSKLNVGTIAGTVAAGDHAHNYDSSYVNVSGDTMSGTLNLPANGLVAGTNQLVLLSGNVGIGTGTPAYTLDVQGGDVNVSGVLRTGGMQRLDASGNLTNIGNLTALGASTFTSGAGSTLALHGGNSSSDVGGQVTMTGGTGGTNQSGGQVALYGGPGGYNGTGGAVTLNAGTGGQSGGTGAYITINGGGPNYGPGGVLLLSSGLESPGNWWDPGHNGAVVMAINGTEYMRVDGNRDGYQGNVGIGTASPGYKLDVNGSINASSSLCIGGSCLSSWPTASQWTTSESNIYYNTGSVGIGTSSPGAKLDVLGEIRTNNQLISTIPTGIAPLQVFSTTMVSNLNSEMVGGYKIANLDTRYGQTTPSQIPSSNTISTVLPSPGINDGLYSSITIGADGIPVIAYFDSSKGYLMVGKCSNSACTSFSNYTYAAGSQGHISIAIGTDGVPVISHISTGGQLLVARCADSNCSTFSSNTGIPVGATGYTSIAIGTDGYPIVAFLQGTNLMTVKCSNAACTATSSIAGVASSSGHISIAMGVDGLPVISHMVGGNLYIGKCVNSVCSVLSNTPTAGATGYTSITIGTDGLPLFSYVSTGGSLTVGKCANTACSTMSSFTSITGSPAYSSIAMGTDGLPTVAYHTGAALGVVRCGNSSCSSNNTVTTVDSSPNVGQYNSITLGTDGNPVISYYDISNGELKVAKCANQFCINNWSRR